LLNRRVKFGFLLLEGGNIATTLLQHLVEPFLQELGHLHLVGSYSDFGFDVGVSVVDDGQEHVQQDEEDKENVRQEVNRCQNSVRFFDRLVIKISKNCAEQGEHRHSEAAEVFDLLTLTTINLRKSLSFFIPGFQKVGSPIRRTRKI
jgi:hypothetical protein